MGTGTKIKLRCLHR